MSARKSPDLSGSPPLGDTATTEQRIANHVRQRLSAKNRSEQIGRWVATAATRSPPFEPPAMTRRLAFAKRCAVSAWAPAIKSSKTFYSPVYAAIPLGFACPLAGAPKTARRRMVPVSRPLRHATWPQSPPERAPGRARVCARRPRAGALPNRWAPNARAAKRRRRASRSA